MKIAISLLIERPDSEAGAIHFWKNTVAEMAPLLRPHEYLYLLISPACRHEYRFSHLQIRYITFPFSGERPVLRVLSEQTYGPIRLPLSGIDVFSTNIAPLFNPWATVTHIKSMHAFGAPEGMSTVRRLYRRLGNIRSVRIAKAIIINSESLRREVMLHLPVDPAKLHLVYEAVDHRLFCPPSNPAWRRQAMQARGIHGPFVLFVSTLYRHKNCHGLMRAWAKVRPALGGRKLVVVGRAYDATYAAELHELAVGLGIAEDVVFIGAVPHREVAAFYQSADLFVYPSFNETFGLTILEAMACACPVITSNVTSMPEVSGSAALLIDPADIDGLAAAIVEALKPDTAARLREMGLARAASFTWRETAARTLEVYRSVVRGRG